ncbi:MAG: hypothetical protein WCY11_14130 [Novosphingobium sp.]
MPDWNTRLVVQVMTGAGAPAETITPIDSFTPTFNTAAEALHSIERTHIGVIYSPRQISFSMTVRAIGGAVGMLTKLALEGTRFSVLLQQQEGDDWAFSSMVLTDCIITSAQPGSATTSGAPSATFSGFSLASTVTQNVDGAEPISVP